MAVSIDVLYTGSRVHGLSHFVTSFLTSLFMTTPLNQTKAQDQTFIPPLWQ